MKPENETDAEADVETAPTQEKIRGLLAHGFRETPKGSHDPHDRQWWFSVRDGRGVRYAVQVRLWRFSRYSHTGGNGEVQDGWDAVCHLKEADGSDFRVDRSVRQETPESIVSWFGGVWAKLGCEYAKLWEV